jgi:hypothetical protein
LLEAKIDLICFSERGLSPGKLSNFLVVDFAAAVDLFSLRWIGAKAKHSGRVVTALGRCPHKEMGCKELKARLIGLLDTVHGVMRSLPQTGRNETGGKTLGLRSPEHGIRHATQSALLMT